MAEVKISTAESGHEYKDEAANRLAKIFRDDPVIRYMLSSLNRDARAAYMQEYFHTLLKAAALSAGIFQQAASWSCIAVWLPPGARLDGPLTILRAGFIPCILKLGLGGAKRMLMDFQAQADALKKRHLKGVKRFYYLFFIGTEEAARGQGLAGRVIGAWQERAGREGVPIWLEATTERSKRVYERCGFGVCGEICMGRGSHGGDGERVEGGKGEGVRMWGMVWWPEGRGDGNGGGGGKVDGL